MRCALEDAVVLIKRTYGMCVPSTSLITASGSTYAFIFRLKVLIAETRRAAHSLRSRIETQILPAKGGGARDEKVTRDAVNVLLYPSVRFSKRRTRCFGGYSKYRSICICMLTDKESTANSDRLSLPCRPSASSHIVHYARPIQMSASATRRVTGMGAGASERARTRVRVADYT